MAQSFETVRLVIAHPNPIIRTGLRGALFSIGFRAITETSSFLKLHDLVEQEAVDLLVTDSEMEGNDTGFLISEMRNQRLGNNPFVITITLLSSGEPDYVKRVIDSGVDDLLLAPVQPIHLIQRVQKLSTMRKPFVVTHDYIGPDRRTKARTFVAPSAPMLDAPNPIKFRAEMTSRDGTRLNRMIEDAATTLNRLKIERLAVQVEWLVTHIHVSIRDNPNKDMTTIQPHINRLGAVGEDMMRRMRGTAVEEQLKPVQDLMHIRKRLEIDAKLVPFQEMERLRLLAKNLSRALAAPTTATSGTQLPPSAAGMDARMGYPT